MSHQHASGPADAAPPTPGSGSGAGRALLAPIMRAWYRRGLAANAFVPRPEGNAAHACGPRPARLLIVGGAGPVIGWGVRCQALALPGQLARILAGSTGRGIDVEVLADPGLALSDAASALAGRDLRYDAVIVVAGIREAVTLRALPAWRRDVTRLLRALSGACPPSARIGIVGIQPVRSVAAFRATGLGATAERHAHRLNGVSRDVCAADPRATFIPLPAPESRREERYRSPADYHRWAELIAQALGAPLSSGAPPQSAGTVRPGGHGGDEAACESDRCPGARSGAGLPADQRA